MSCCKTGRVEIEMAAYQSTHSHSTSVQNRYSSLNPSLAAGESIGTAYPVFVSAAGTFTTVPTGNTFIGVSNTDCTAASATDVVNFQYIDTNDTTYFRAYFNATPTAAQVLVGQSYSLVRVAGSVAGTFDFFIDAGSAAATGHGILEYVVNTPCGVQGIFKRCC